MKKSVWILALLWSGCVRNQGNGLWLKDVIAAVAPACTIDPGATLIRVDGVRDLALVPLNGYGYYISPRLFNQLQPTAEEPVRIGQRQNVRNEQNQLNIQGFNVCYEFQNDGAPQAIEEGLPDCEELGLETTFLRSSANAAPVNLNTVAGTDLFPPHVTANNTNFILNDAEGYKVVRVHMRAMAKTQDGRTITSNELVFPVTLCLGCLMHDLPQVRNPESPSCKFGEVLQGDSICSLGQDTAGDCIAVTP